jgi:hypothetical protein
LPSTDRIQDYHWQLLLEKLTLWDSAGLSEQARRAELRDRFDHAAHADLVLLATPALDPSVVMGFRFSEIPGRLEILVIQADDRHCHQVDRCVRDSRMAASL